MNVIYIKLLNFYSNLDLDEETYFASLRTQSYWKPSTYFKMIQIMGNFGFAAS